MKKEISSKLGACLSFHYGTSRGRDTYGYNICTLKVNGVKAGQCNGGGYDMKGTSLSEWMSSAFESELLNLARTRSASTFNSETKSYVHHTKPQGGKFVKGKGWVFPKPGPDYREKCLYGLTYYTATDKKPESFGLDGGCGLSSMEDILSVLGLALSWKPTSKKDGVYIVTEAKPRR